MTRLPKQRTRVYTMLEEAGPQGVSTGQFLDERIPRFAARIHELRDLGHVIDKKHLPNGEYRYVLVQGEGQLGLTGGV